MRALAPLLVLLALLAPASAQTPASPITGDFTEVYVVAGRAIGGDGKPMPQAVVVIDIEQKGVVLSEPLRAAANCKGDFIASFTLRHVDPEGRARLSVMSPDGRSVAGTTTVPLDPFYRRSDAVLRADTPWPYTCSREPDIFNVSASVSVRLVNRTAPYERDGETFHARPYGGIVGMRYYPPNGNNVCPPHPLSGNPDECELFQADERGDLRYTFTLDAPFEAGGYVEFHLYDNKESIAAKAPDAIERVDVERVSRLGTKYFEVTGQGAPPELYDTPGPAFLALLGAVGMALGARTLLSPRRP